MKDYLQKAYAFDGTVRIYAALTTNLVNEAQQIHDLWPTASAAFGRLLTASVTMGAMYKGALNHDDHELSIRFDANGPLEGMVATTNSKGQVRGYVGNPHVFLQYNDGKLNVGQAVGQGQIHVTKDLKVRDIFTSSVEITSGEIAEDFAYYFTSSEQIPSVVSLGVKVNEDNTVKTSGGFILQLMPGYKEETVQKIEDKLKNFPSISDLLEQGHTPESMIDLLTDGDHKLLEQMDLEYYCDCQRDKFERGLISLGSEQLKTILEEDGKIETTCHFCHAKYEFNETDIKVLIEEANKK